MGLTPFFESNKMSELRIVSFDPSLNNTGMSFGLYDLDTGAVRYEDIDLFESKFEKGKSVRQVSHDYERARAAAEHMRKFLAKHKPNLLCAELPSGGQSARAVLSFGITVGLQAAISHVPMIQVTPREVKHAVTGRWDGPEASKDAIMAWAYNTAPHLPWAFQMRKGKQEFLKKNEHAADACAAIRAAVETQEFARLIATLSAVTA